MRRHAKAIVAISALLLTLMLGAAPATAAPPTVAIDPSATASYTTADVSGTINPNGGPSPIAYYFEYSKDPGSEGWTNFIFAGEISGAAAEGTNPIPVSGELTGLSAGTEYEVRLTAVYETVEYSSPEPNTAFTTLAVAKPTVLTADDADAAYTSAKVSGSVERPAGADPAFDAKCRFEYVTGAQFAIDGFASASSTACDVNPVTATGPTPVEAELTGLGLATTYHLRLVAQNAGGADALEANTFTTLAVAKPAVAIDPVTAFTGSSAHFSGTIEPGTPPGDDPAFDVDWHFECTPACPGLKGGEIKADNSDPEVEVEADASGLEPNTNYEVRLIASNLGGEEEAGPESFKTSQLGPEVQTFYAGDLGTGSATLAGQVNPKNAPITYQFEWGTDTSYGNLAPASPEALGVANNAFNVVTVPITGLEPGTTYHFRLVATNTGTSAVGEGLDHSFTTLEPTGPPAPCANAAVRSQQSTEFLLSCRAYEKVSPAEKGTLSVVAPIGARSISADGSHASYLSGGTPPDAQSSNGNALTQVAARSQGSGWSSQTIEPPILPNAEDPFSEVTNLSEDLTHSTIASTAALAPGGIHGKRNLYLRNNLDGSYQAVTTDAGSSEPYAAGLSSDFKSAAFVSRIPQTNDPGITPGYFYPYIWRDGVVHLAGVLPDGEIPEFGGFVGSGISVGNTVHALSRDGERLVFHARVEEENPLAPQGSNAGPLYVRTEDGASPPSTVHVNASQRAVPDPAGPLPALYWSAEAEHGSKVLFSSCEKLTEDSTADATGFGCSTSKTIEVGQGSDLYLFDVESGETTDLTAAGPSGSGFRGVVGTSDDLSSIYLVATGVLDEGALAGRPNLYLWRNGQMRFIATLSNQDGGNWSPFSQSGGAGENRIRFSRVSPGGDFALLTSRVPLTGYANVAASGSCGVDENGNVAPANCTEVFRYDAGADQLSCVSCPSQGADPFGDASLFRIFGSSSFSDLPRNLSDDGDTVFFQSLAPLVASDVNEKQDVYEWSDGEVQLVSSGSSSEPSYFFDATISGSDVLFRTQSQLTGADRDEVADVYDARIGGGFFEQAPPTPCSGDGCRNALGSPPADPSPATPSFSGPGNASPKPPKCARNKVKRKGKCVTRKEKKQRRSGKRAAGKNHGGAK